MHPDVERVLFTAEDIQAAVERIGGEIEERYADVEPGSLVFVGLLRGSAIFMSDLVRAVNLPLEMDYMVVSSYGNNAKSSGSVKVIKDVSSDIADKHVIVVEDVLDSGLTLSKTLEHLKAKKPASIEIVTLVLKNVDGQKRVECSAIGFDCPNEFIVGYGLDYAERYRNLPYIGVLKPEVYS